MNFPDSFDLLAVTELSFNACYFAGDDDCEKAASILEKLFPNAEVMHAFHDDDMSACVLNIETPQELPSDEWSKVYRALEDALPEGPYKGQSHLFHPEDEEGTWDIQPPFDPPATVPSCAPTTRSK